MEELSLNEMVEKIKAIELKVLSTKEAIVDMKKKIELSLNSRMINLKKKYDKTKDPKLSTKGKREIVAKEDEAISKSLKQIRDKEREIKTLRIERDYLRRKLRVAEYENSESVQLKEINETLKKMCDKGLRIQK